MDAERKRFATPDEVREFPKGRLGLIKIGGAVVGRAVFEPGWRWATSVQPIAKTDSCEAPHFRYHVSGLLRIPSLPSSDRNAGGHHRQKMPMKSDFDIGQFGVNCTPCDGYTDKRRIA